MPERTPTFFDEERQQIEVVARQVAGLGEDCIFNLVHMKAKMMKATLAWHESPNLMARFPTRDLMIHEIDVMDEIIRLARVVIQFQGSGEKDLMDRQAMLVGLGSVFDPNSQITKDQKDRFGR